MGSTLAASSYFSPTLSLRSPLLAPRRPLPLTPPQRSARRCLVLTTRAAAPARGGGGQKAYRQSHSQAPSPAVAVKEIANFIVPAGTFLAFTLGGNNIHASGVSEIALVLKDNSVITTLELGYNPIGLEGAKALCEILKFHGKVQTWLVSGAKGAEFIADALKYNTTLCTLDLHANGLGDDGAVCLARSLKIVNEALSSLDLGFNEIRDTGAFALAQAHKANEDVTIDSLNLASNFLTKYGQIVFPFATA